MKICFISSLHPPDDKRVHYKEAVSLANAGYEVWHVCPVEDECSNGFTKDGVNVVTFSGRRTVSGRIAQLLKLYRLAKTVNADTYHCNEIDSWAIGVLLKVRMRVQVVFDVHEVYSTNISERLFPKWMRPAVEGVVRFYFRLLLLFTDRIVLAKKTAEKDFPELGKKAVLVQNFVETKQELEPSKGYKKTSAVVALHLGAVNRARGWPQMLEAMGMVENPEVCITVTGRFGDGTRFEFLEDVRRRGLADRVIHNEWIPYDEVPRHTAECDIGLIMFQPVHDNFVNALPHKLFDYMLAGLPVIVPGFAVEVRDIVERADCGLIVDTTSPYCIAKALNLLAEDAKLRMRLGGNGREAVLRKYNWETEAKKLIEMYRSISRHTDIHMQTKR